MRRDRRCSASRRVSTTVLAFGAVRSYPVTSGTTGSLVDVFLVRVTRSPVAGGGDRVAVAKVAPGDSVNVYVLASGEAVKGEGEVDRSGTGLETFVPCR